MCLRSTKEDNERNNEGERVDASAGVRGRRRRSPSLCRPRTGDNVQDSRARGFSDTTPVKARLSSCTFFPLTCWEVRSPS